MDFISGSFQALSQESQNILVAHCALINVQPPSQWSLDVKCHSGNEDWKSLVEVYPDAKMKVSSNDILVTLPPLEGDLVIAAFGTPGDKDIKRKQMAIFARKPVKGRNWTVSVRLYDDTKMAFENVKKEEQKRGRELLTPRTGLFVANIDEDVKIELNHLEPGWQVKGSSAKIIKSTDAWNSPENATDFPSCCFEICHVDETKESFSCTVTASHGAETSEQEIFAVFKQEKEGDSHTEESQPKKDAEVPKESTAFNAIIPQEGWLSMIPTFLIGAHVLMICSSALQNEMSDSDLFVNVFATAVLGSFLILHHHLWLQEMSVRSAKDEVALSGRLSMIPEFLIAALALMNCCRALQNEMSDSDLFVKVFAMAVLGSFLILHHHLCLQGRLSVIPTFLIAAHVLMICSRALQNEMSHSDILKVFAMAVLGSFLILHHHLCLQDDRFKNNGAGYGFVNAGLEDKPPNFGNRIKVRCCEGEGSSVDKPPNLGNRIKFRRWNGRETCIYF